MTTLRTRLWFRGIAILVAVLAGLPEPMLVLAARDQATPNVGDRKLLLARKAEAVALARRAIALEPDASGHHAMLARALSEQGWYSEYVEALVEALRAVDLARDDWEKQGANQSLDYVKQRAARGPPWADVALDACITAEDVCARAATDLERACATDAGGSTCFALALIHKLGKGLPADMGKAAAIFKKLCDLGDTRGCIWFAWHQARGEGIAKDETAGMALLDRMCDRKRFEACTRLAVLYADRQTKGAGAKARKLVEKACGGGDETACGLLPRMPR